MLSFQSMFSPNFGPCGEEIVSAAEAGKPGALLALVGINTAYADGAESPHDIASWMPVVECPLRRCSRQIIVCVQANGDVTRTPDGETSKICIRNNTPSRTS